MFSRPGARIISMPHNASSSCTAQPMLSLPLPLKEEEKKGWQSLADLHISWIHKTFAITGPQNRSHFSRPQGRRAKIHMQYAANHALVRMGQSHVLFIDFEERDGRERSLHQISQWCSLNMVISQSRMEGGFFGARGSVISLSLSQNSDKMRHNFFLFFFAF